MSTLASTAASHANTVPTDWGQAACSLPPLRASVNGFRGASHRNIPKARGASALDVCQLTKCFTPGYRSLAFCTQERNIHLDTAALAEAASVRVSCSSAWKRLLLIYVAPCTNHCLLLYILMQNAGNRSETEVKFKPLKAAGQLEKHRSPTFPDGHVKR